ncbi:single-stranded DNA-binding protein [Clostridioides sp. ES-S-0001-03]|uniref:single-stranded DNA-binding protein n=1 Tax=Clostridioides sp. ES-S-0001-03 TaxID=2770771 RepID=UPI001D0C29AC|nr:single-stranded DNA-binding protein [Clostridioides sp. ES-S-0001-03]
MNNACLVGRLTKDPELKYIPVTGTAVATFTLAIDRDYKNKDGEKETDFIPVEAFGKLAEVCSNNLEKGRLIAVQGSIRVETSEKDGEKKTYTKVHINKMNFLDSKKQTSNKEPSYKAIYDDPDIPF